MRKRLLFSLIPLILLFGGAEIALRVAGWPPAADSRQFTHSQIYWVEDASLRLEAIPHKETGGSFRVSTDANGLRAPLHAEEKPANTFRILTLGCSTTFGWGVDDNQTYPWQLESTLQQGRTPEQTKIEVINGGQPGYSSFQGLWLWERTLKRYQPDLVVFGYIVQDSRKVAWSDLSQAVLQQNADFLKQNILYNLKTYLFLLNLYRGHQIEAKETKQENYRIPLDQYTENIRTFKKLSESVGAEMMLFGYPLERDGYTAGHRQILHAAADILKLPIYDPQPEFEQITAQQTLFFPQDRGHANAEGNALIAKGMAQFLVASKIVE